MFCSIENRRDLKRSKSILRFCIEKLELPHRNLTFVVHTKLQPETYFSTTRIKFLPKKKRKKNKIQTNKLKTLLKSWMVDFNSTVKTSLENELQKTTVLSCVLV